jgi:ABC-type transport system involved in multi-copper enzyme maturation permease subunit
MLFFIVKKEILKHLRDLRFILLLAIATILAVTAAVVFRGEFEKELQQYRTMVIRAGEQTNLEETYVVKPPTPFGFVNLSDWNLANQMRLEPKVLYYQTTDVTGQSIIESSPHLDWLFIFVYVFSFFAIIITYDTVAGEKEQGTLRLILANSCSRSTVILATFIGNTLILWLPLLGVSFLSLSVITMGGSIQFAPQDWLRIALVILMSTLFVAVMGLVGVLASVLFHRAASALITALLFWATLTIIIPSGVGVWVEYVVPAPSLKELHNKLWAAKMEKFQQLGISGMTIWEIVARDGLTEAQKRERLAAKQAELNAERERVLETSSTRVAAILDAYLNQLFVQVDLMRRLSQISPASAYEYAVEEILPAGYVRQRLFIDAAKRHLSDYTQTATSLRKALREKAEVNYARTAITYDGSTYELYGLESISYADMHVDGHQFPSFQMHIPNAKRSFETALWHVAILTIFGLVVFTIAYTRFLTYDPR